MKLFSQVSLIEFEIYKKLATVLLVCLLLERQEEVLDSVCSESRLTKDAHDLKHWPTNLEVMLDDGNEAICDDGNVCAYTIM